MATYFKNSESYTIDWAKCIKATERAILVEIAEEAEPIWIPRSQILYDAETWDEDDENELVITEWIAEQKGLL
jgi:hypothetical protein